VVSRRTWGRPDVSGSESTRISERSRRSGWCYVAWNRSFAAATMISAQAS
jgi:hypothetical protein